ncbi:MAG: hypothetical protein KC933_28050 [Myxococcales bacterium]|nr:hypothetical protein [Myxococcales bacterium]
MRLVLRRYQTYDQAQILAAFSDDPASFEGDGWVVVERHVLGFFEIGERSPKMHFCRQDQFHWYGPAVDGVPPCLVSFRDFEGGHVFIRAAAGLEYTYLADIQHVGMHGGGPESCQAMMDVSPPIPTHVLAALGGLYLHPSGDAAMNSAVTSLRNATTAQDRLTALQGFVEYWRGPIPDNGGLPEEELWHPELGAPKLLQSFFRWAGRCEDVVNAGYFSLVRPEALEVYDRSFVAICTECQWCGNYFVRLDEVGEEDPEILVDDCGEGHNGAGYTPLRIGLSHFLWLFYIVFNAAGGPICGSIELSASEHLLLTALLPPLPVAGPQSLAYRAMFPCCGPGPHEATASAFAGDGLMGYVLREDGESRMHFSSKTERSLAELLSKLGIDPSRVDGAY